MKLDRWIRKMPCRARKFVRVIKFLLAGVTIFCVSWIASVNEWHGGVRWQNRRGSSRMSTMKTIVAYSEGKQAELDRPSPVACDRLPAVPTLLNFNRTWTPNVAFQSTWQQVVGTRVSLYAAFYDERLPQRYIRILASFQGRNLSAEKTLYCQTRQLDPYEDALEVVAAKPLEIWYRDWDIISRDVQTPLLLSCPLTDPLYGPSIVSIVTEPCDDPTNAFAVKPSQLIKFKRNFTICVKDMHFNKDISHDVIEWIETNKILGVDMIDIYVDHISKESEKVLSHYQSEGYVRLFHVPIKDKLNRSLWQRRRDHIITYNDCLYRNIEESEYIVPLDIDEIIIPKVADTWSEMIERFKKLNSWRPNENSAILVQNVFFFDFMQDVQTYKKQKKVRKSKMYVKRDDVRIKDSNNVDIGEIELIHDVNTLDNDILDSDETKLFEEYRRRCGRELRTPKLMQHIVSSALVSPVGFYGKSLMVSRKVLTAFNHYPLASLGVTRFAGWAAPFSEVQLNHYKESCNATIVVECARYGRRARVDRLALRLRSRLVRALASTICTGINAT